ncbi:MAG: anhydro-N-acetylmuramic acid kinase [Burkholderiales bacterium]|jgi:anhydro-N-acetylmuramic acid kinase|nr:anhydro-N-acetylmuramic acid kinase [Burkholderiales bacterium]
MSGTSLDGVDAALVDFSAGAIHLLAGHHLPYDDRVRAAALALSASGDDEIHRAATLGNELSSLYARAVSELLDHAGVRAADVVATGCHGQTVRHRPDAGYTVQLANPALLAELSGTRVVADFRARDLAAGGQGAPLVPAFHAAVFRDPKVHRAVVNVGGIANITDLPATGAVRGFDTGPGNMLLDAWAGAHIGARFDRCGAWAASGKVDQALLDALLADPYFAAPPPKSTGRERFHHAWLARHDVARLRPEDVQATLAELTARSIVDAARRHCPGIEAFHVCGGGAKNADLVARLTRSASPATVASTAALRVDPEWVEAMAFAWLARQAILGLPGNLPDVTGARGARVLGAIYPA